MEMEMTTAITIISTWVVKAILDKVIKKAPIDPNTTEEVVGHILKAIFAVIKK